MAPQKENKDNIACLAEFMKAMGQGVSLPFPLALKNGNVLLGLQLIEEEFTELKEAIDDLVYKDNLSNMNHMVKELADLLYVVYWFAACLGIDIDSALKIVHKSNMSKLGDDGKPIKREDGKVMKGPNYKAPDMSRISMNTPITL